MEETCGVPPSADDVKSLLSDIRSGGNFKSMGEAQRWHNMGRRKISQVAWCLAEALKQRWRAFLMIACTINLLRDERHKRLQIRFRAAGQVAGELMCGWFGINKTHESSTAIEITEATRNQMEIFCTRFYGAPFANSIAKVKGDFDQELFDHILKTCEAITVDSAGDEIASAYDSSAPNSFTALSLGMLCFLPNLLHILRDKAHAIRKLMTRPWTIDPTLENIMDLFVTGRGSLLNMIENSIELKMWLKDFSEKNKTKVISSVFSSVRAASHRFESYLSPMVRFVMDFDAFLALAIKISILRHDTVPGQNARFFLETINEEICIMIALLCECGDECLQLLRIYDVEAPDSTSTVKIIRNFLDRIVFLFPQRGVLRTCGYLSHMANILKKQRNFTVNGVARVIGDADVDIDAILEKCLPYFDSWVLVAHSLIRAEFPSFEISQSFNVFDMIEKEQPDIDQLEANTRILAAGFKDVDATVFADEYLDRFPYARREYRNGASIRASWAIAIEEGKKRRGGSRLYYSIWIVFQRCMCWSLSTSGLESCFSKVAHHIKKSQLSFSEQTESNMFILINVELNGLEMESLVKEAQAIWNRVYGFARQHTVRRTDSGVILGPRKPKQVSSLQTWTSRRRTDVKEKMEAEMSPGQGIASIEELASQPRPSTWVEAHETEVRFHNVKAHKRFLQNYDLLPESLRICDEEASEYKKKQQKLRDSRTKTHIKQQGRLQSIPPTLDELHGKSLYIPPDMRSADVDDRCALLHLSICDSLFAQPNIFLTSNYTEDFRLRFAAMLMGGWIIDKTVLLGLPGFSVLYTATQTRRHIWVADAFQLEDPEAWELMQSFCGRGKVWNLIRNVEDFIARKA